LAVLRPREGVCGAAKIFGSALLQPARSVCVSQSAFSFKNYPADRQTNRQTHKAKNGMKFSAIPGAHGMYLKGSLWRRKMQERKTMNQIAGLLDKRQDSYLNGRP